MVEFSTFTEFGMLEFSSKPPTSESVYHSIIANVNGDVANNYSVEEGSRLDCWAYVVGMAVGRAQGALDAAVGENDSRRIQAFTSFREAEYKLVPGPKDGMDKRRASITAARHASGGGRVDNVYSALQTLLGATFRGLRYSKPGEVASWPASPATSPVRFTDPATPFKIVSLVNPISLLGPQVVPYQIVTGDGFAPLNDIIRKGDTLVVSVDHWSLAERVSVTATGRLSDTYDTFTASFTMAHEAGSIVTSGDYPIWASTQREVLVVLTTAGAADPETRRRVNELLERCMRASTVWSIVAETSPGHCGPFLIDDSPLGMTTLGDVTFP